MAPRVPVARPAGHKVPVAAVAVAVASVADRELGPTRAAPDTVPRLVVALLAGLEVEADRVPGVHRKGGRPSVAGVRAPPAFAGRPAPWALAEAVVEAEGQGRVVETVPVLLEVGGAVGRALGVRAPRPSNGLGRRYGLALDTSETRVRPVQVVGVALAAPAQAVLATVAAQTVDRAVGPVTTTAVPVACVAVVAVQAAVVGGAHLTDAGLLPDVHVPADAVAGGNRRVEAVETAPRA